MTTPNDLQKYPASRNGINVLLIGNEGNITETSCLLWDALPKFGEVGIMKGVSLNDAPFVDLEDFQLFFFHLPSLNASAELGALISIREKHRTDKTVCVLIIPELGSDIPVNAADFVLTQPITMEKMEKVLRGCRLVTERDQSDSKFSTSSVTEPHRLDFDGHGHEDGVSEQDSTELDDGSGPSEVSWRCGSPSLTDNSVHALLHSQKEQKRRLQIKKCCNRLRDLLPFVNGRLDAASTLELTVAYMSYLQQHMPADILQKVQKALEDTRPATWYKSSKLSKNRKRQALKERTAVTTVEDFAEDFIAAHVLGRHIQPRTQTTPPQNVPAHPVTVRQSFVPLMDLTTGNVPLVIMQQAPHSLVNPMVINQTPASQLPLVMTQNCVPTDFFQQPPSFLPHGVMDYTFAPQINVNATFSHVGMSNQYETVMVDQNFPLAGFDPPCPQAGPLYMANQSYAPMMVLNQTRTDPHVLDEPHDPVRMQPSTSLTAPGEMSTSSSFMTASPWSDLLAPELKYEAPAPTLPSFSTFLRDSSTDLFPQRSSIELQSSPTWPTFSQVQWPWLDSQQCTSAVHTTQDFLQDLLGDLPCGFQDDNSLPSNAQMSFEMPILELCEQQCPLSPVSTVTDLL